VNGAVLAWVEENEPWVWMWPDGSFECFGTANGTQHMFSMRLGDLHGPGAYAATDASYAESWCDGDTNCTNDVFGLSPASATCVAHLDVAPNSTTIGSKVSGTFTCSPLAGTENPAQVVTVYAGSFWAMIGAPPD
jgi:hypothetical protein